MWHLEYGMKTIKVTEFIEHTIDLQPIKGKDDIFAWRKLSHRILDTGKKVTSKSETQGLVLKEGISHLKNGKLVDAVETRENNQYNDYGYWVIVPQSALEDVAKWGYYHNNKDIFDRTSKKPYSDANKKDMVLVLACSYNHTIYNADREHLVVGMYCDYLNTGNFHNGKYDLEKARKILSKRKDVHSLSEIKLIQPYTNRSPGHSHNISFYWSPDVNTYRTIMDKAESKIDERLRSPGSGAIGRVEFDLDLLGLRAGGAALHDNYHDSNESN